MAGSPNSFTPSSGSSGDAGAVSKFVLTPQDGNAMTNIGNCVPSAAMVGLEDVKSVALDAMFARATANPSGTAAQIIGLPEHLGETDLFTLDSATLAQYGVVAYAPAYPLWSDDAGKLRFVRVPRGKSIHFDKATQTFDIPPNTRFYKTFMKQIIDTDGSYRYRKIETRLIVARPDQTNIDGSTTQTALFGSYKWTDDESDAVLVETPLNSGKPFADTLFTYNTDENLAADVLSAQPDARIALGLKRRLGPTELRAAIDSGAIAELISRVCGCLSPERRATGIPQWSRTLGSTSTRESNMGISWVGPCTAMVGSPVDPMPTLGVDRAEPAWPTVVIPVRTGSSPVMKFARPAVQLASA